VWGAIGEFDISTEFLEGSPHNEPGSLRELFLTWLDVLPEE